MVLNPLCILKEIINLKVHNHLLGNFLNMSIYIYWEYIILYTPNINLTKFEPLKPSRSGDISLLVFKISKEAVKQPCLDQKKWYLNFFWAEIGG